MANSATSSDKQQKKGRNNKQLNKLKGKNAAFCLSL